jgi:hypothetical protein
MAVVTCPGCRERDERICALEQRVGELEAQLREALARLGTNATNSSVPSVRLAQGVLRAMFLTKIKMALAVVLAVAAVAIGSWGSFRAQDHFGKSQPPAVEAPTPPADQPRKVEKDKNADDKDKKKDQPILWTPRLLGAAEVALPDRVVQSDLVVSGRVVALEPKDVEAVLAAAPPTGSITGSPRRRCRKSFMDKKT